jgi:hypothetical protein
VGDVFLLAATLSPLSLAAFSAPLTPAGQGDVFLVAATLRPETMYGQTNCWALPEGEYGAYRWVSHASVVLCSALSHVRPEGNKEMHAGGAPRPEPVLPPALFRFPPESPPRFPRSCPPLFCELRSSPFFAAAGGSTTRSTSWLSARPSTCPTRTACRSRASQRSC